MASSWGHDEAASAEVSMELRLRALGLGEYCSLLRSAVERSGPAADFPAAAITDRRLVELGVASARHRQLILSCLHPLLQGGAASADYASSAGSKECGPDELVYANDGSDDFRPPLPPKVSATAGRRGHSTTVSKGSKPLPRPRVVSFPAQIATVLQRRQQQQLLPPSLAAFVLPSEAGDRAADRAAASVSTRQADEGHQHGRGTDAAAAEACDAAAAAATSVLVTRPLPSASKAAHLVAAAVADDGIVCQSDRRLPPEVRGRSVGAAGSECSRLAPSSQPEAEADGCAPPTEAVVAEAALVRPVAKPLRDAAVQPAPRQLQRASDGEGRKAGQAADGGGRLQSTGELAEPDWSLPPLPSTSHGPPVGIALAPAETPSNAGSLLGDWQRLLPLGSSLPEPLFLPPLLPPSASISAVSLAPLAMPKRKPRMRDTIAERAAGQAAQATTAAAAADATTVAAVVAAAAAAAAESAAANEAQADDTTTAYSGQCQPCGNTATVSGFSRAPVAAMAQVVVVESPCQLGSDAGISADGELPDCTRRDDPGCQDRFHLSAMHQPPGDSFADTWSPAAVAAAWPTGDRARLADAAPETASSAAAAEFSRADHPWPAADPSAGVVDSLLVVPAAAGAERDRLSDSLPLAQLFPGAFDSTSSSTAIDGEYDEYNASIDNQSCSFRENSLYGTWGMLGMRSWDDDDDDTVDHEADDDDGVDGCDSDGSQDGSGDDCSSSFRSTDNLAESTSDATAADSDVKRSPSGKVSADALQTLKSPMTPRSVYRAGYLYKQGGVQHNKGWRKRYVTFDGQVLKYFSNKKSRISKRIVPLATMVEVENDIKETDSNRFRFLLKCINRVFWFAAETLDDCHLWASTLMQAILRTQAHGVGLKPGGDMNEPDVYGNIFIDGLKHRRFVAIKGGRLCYYNNFNDFKLGSPIHQLEMEIASVKDFGKMRLQLSTPYHQYILAFSSDEEIQLWKTAIEDSIATALSDDTVLSTVYQNEFNQKCADCNSPNPHWSVLHLGVVICKKCAGIHRQMWPFNVKSLRMDLRVWTPDLVKLFISYGNGSANGLWERDLPAMLKITESSDLHSRQAFIQNKYQRKAYFRFHPLTTDHSSLHKALLKCVQTDFVSETFQLIHSGANINERDEDGQNAIDMARAVQHPLQTELLKHISLDLDQGTVYNSQAQGLHVQRIIMKSGYLTEVERKEGIRRWAVLDLEALSYYQDENMPTLKGIIRMSEVVSIRKRENEKYLPLFSITLLSDGGKDVILAADSYEGLHAWMENLYKVQTKLLRIAEFGDLTSVALLTGSNDYTMAGSVFIKEGTGAAWRQTWLVMQGKVLVMCDIKAQQISHADLRKVVKIMITKQDFSGSLSSDLSGTVLVIDLPNRALYVQSDLHLDTQSWMQAIRKACQENTQSLGDQQLTNDNVAVAVDTCINFISTYAMRVEGIYRVSGIQSAVTHLLESFIKDARGVHLRAEGTSVHEVTSVLKRYLQSLTEPLMTAGLHQRWLDTVAVRDTDRRQDDYKRLLTQLPSVNYCTLKRLIGHLKRVSELSSNNKMTVANLGTIFGPLLMTSAGEAMNAAHYAQTGKEIQIVCELVTCYQSLFEVDSKELEKERKMEEYILKLQKAQQQQPAAAPSASSAAPFILGVYAGSRDGKCVTVKVVLHTTASEVMLAFPTMPSAYTTADLTTASLSNVHGIFEVVGNDELERQLDASDAVLPATLRWGSWGELYRCSTYLCAKLSSSLWIDVGSKTFPACSRYNDIQHCSGKSWSKVHVEVAGGCVMYYKPGKSSSTSATSEWHVHDIVVYAGVEEKRTAPTRFGATVLLCEVDRPPEKSGPPHGHSFCFGTETELQVWMANVRYAKACTPKRSPSVSGLLAQDGSHSSTDSLNTPGSDKSKVSIVLNHLRSFKLSSILK